MSSRRLALIFGDFPPALGEPESPAPALPSTVLAELRHSLRSDEDLAEALRRGDPDALTALFKRYSRLVFSIARRILRHDAEAEDCVQQIFFDVFRAINQYDRSKAPLRTWLLQFAYHRTLNRRRSLIAARVFTNEPLEDFMPEFLASNCGEEAQLHNRLFLKKALGQLEPRQQRTIELTYYEGLTAGEIAARTGESVRVVRHNLYRGLEKLRLHFSASGLCASKTSMGKGGPR